MTTVEKAKRKADEILGKSQKEISEIEDTMEGFRIKLNTASTTMDEASDSCDLDAYNAAREEKRTASGALEMYQKRIDKLQKDPLISADEYNKLCDGIRQEVNTYFDKLEGDLFEISQKLEAMHDEADGRIKEANDVLQVLQMDLFRGADLEYSGTSKQPSSGSVKKVGNRHQWDLVQWADRMNECAEYQAMKKKREEK